MGRQWCAPDVEHKQKRRFVVAVRPSFKSRLLLKAVSEVHHHKLVDLSSTTIKESKLALAKNYETVCIVLSFAERERRIRGDSECATM